MLIMSCGKEDVKQFFPPFFQMSFSRQVALKSHLSYQPPGMSFTDDFYHPDMEWKQSQNEWQLWAHHKKVWGVGLKSMGEITQGNIPIWLQNPEKEDQVLEPLESFMNPQEVLSEISQELKVPMENIKIQEKLWVPLNSSQLLPAYRLIIQKKPIPLEVIVESRNGNIMNLESLGFFLEGHANVHRDNILIHPEEEEVTLQQLEDSGKYLKNKHIEVYSCRNQEFIPELCSYYALGNRGDFTSIKYKQTKYDEVFSYFSLVEYVNWAQKLLGKSSDQLLPLPLQVYTRARIFNPSNGKYTDENAMYLPYGESGTDNPSIIIGSGYDPENGDSPPRKPVYLKLLGKDGDVVRHEFGHHILYDNLKKITGQSGVMHEGYADYMNYAYTGRNQLASSIVSTGSPLRQATITKGNVSHYIPSENSSRNSHQYASFWSSVLWQGRQRLGTDSDGAFKMDHIVFESFKGLKWNAQYYDAIVTLGQAAKQIYGLEKEIYHLFYEFGFLETAGKNGILPSPSAALLQGDVDSSDAAPKITLKTETIKSKSSFCGVVSLDSHQSHFPWESLGIIIITLAAYCGSKHEKRGKRNEQHQQHEM